MPARKPDLEMIPHATAVMMAPESPLRTQVIEHAQRIMAGRMQMLELMLGTFRAALARASQFLTELAARPAPDPAAPPRREPNAVSLAQCNRTITLGMQVVTDMDRLREAAFQEAREAAYRRTMQRVGPLFWSLPDLPGAPDIDQATFAPKPARPETAWTAPLAETATQTAAATKAAPKAAPEPDPEPAPEEAGLQLLTKRTLRQGQEAMARAGVPREVQIDLARRARQQQWTVGQFQAEVAAAVAESVVRS